MGGKRYTDYFAKVQYLQKHINNEQMHITYEERMMFKNRINQIIKNMEVKSKKMKDDQIRSKKLGSFYQRMQNKCDKQNCKEG